MKHLISSRTALCLCGLTLCFNASAQGYVSYNHDAAKMNQIMVQEIGAGGLTPAFYYDALHNSYQKSASKKEQAVFQNHGRSLCIPAGGCCRQHQSFPYPTSRNRSTQHCRPAD